ncbi:MULTISPECIES: metal-sensing transcriptional repressor [unclassified Marinitoga]|uniref:metal-sensing transcriptional repressor n=1 Tax=unclassified Marinitoga TaxID=2640159 RepID=UPI00064162A1|nr:MULTISPECIES: metal-sensing transcriptional repressor [unclassified Marinitoga]KLO22454.1 copper-sensing transcriptional repressor [Marinitoga sp. 1155]NUV00250.1 CsoR family transcriptional regulator [Marinitoga sp. 1154]
MHNKKDLNILKTAKGQVEAVIKMVEDERYCIDISRQILASIALLKKANAQILNSHLESCVKNAAYSNNSEEVNVKIIELEEIMNYINKTI